MSSPPQPSPTASRTAQYEQQLRRLQGQGLSLRPILPFKRKILCESFWGQKWCQFMGTYGDTAELQQGRRLLREGAVFHVAVDPLRLRALVGDDPLRQVTIRLKAPPTPHWSQSWAQRFRKEGISWLQLLGGALPDSLFQEMLSEPGELLPPLDTLTFRCLCPSTQEPCSHAAAAIYGLAVLCDQNPSLYFLWRGIGDWAASPPEPSPPPTDGQWQEWKDIFQL